MTLVRSAVRRAKTPEDRCIDDRSIPPAEAVGTSQSVSRGRALARRGTLFDPLPR